MMWTLDTWLFLAAQVSLCTLTVAVFRRYFSCISDIPGPFIASFTRLWHIGHIVIGDLPLQLIDLHDKYGHFIRISYNEISISHPDAVQQILSSLNKAPWRYQPSH
ncbi:hypothetical protein HRG_014478 [Hirsutella rhossiliensis]